jgi:hypothetical protein
MGQMFKHIKYRGGFGGGQSVGIQKVFASKN